MQEGVAKANCFLLFLSKGTMARPYVQFELRTAIKHCRKGVDPAIESTFVVSCKYCKTQSGRGHMFLCRARYATEGKRGANNTEKGAADAIWRAINEYLAGCRSALKYLQVRHARARVHHTRECAHASAERAALRLRVPSN